MADASTPEDPPSYPDFGHVQFNSTANLVELEKKEKEPVPDGPPDYRSGPPPSYITSMPYDADPEMVKPEVKSGQLPPSESYRMHLILSCVVTWLCFIVFGAIAFVLTIFARRRASKGESKVAGQFATASLVLSAVGIVVGIALWGVIIWAAVDANTSCSKYECGGECWEYVTTIGMEDGCKKNYDSYCYNDETNECFSNVEQGSMNCSKSNMSSSTTPAPCTYTCDGKCYSDKEETGNSNKCDMHYENSCYDEATGICYYGAYSAGGDGSGQSSSTVTSSTPTPTTPTPHASTSTLMPSSSPSGYSCEGSVYMYKGNMSSEDLCDTHHDVFCYDHVAGVCYYNDSRADDPSTTPFPYDGPYKCLEKCYLLSTTYEKCGGGGGGMGGGGGGMDEIDVNWCYRLFEDSCTFINNCYFNPPDASTNSSTSSSSETIGPYMCENECYVYSKPRDEDTCYSHNDEACYDSGICYYN